MTTLLDEAPVTGLRVEDGTVVGVTARQGNHDLVFQAGVTVLATDGFAGNRALMQEYCAELGDPFHGGVSTATGDSIGWLRPLGAEFRNMSSCLRHGQVTLRGTRVNPALPWLGAVLVNRRGERFVDEQAHGYSGLAGVIQAQPDERAVMIWDAEAHVTAQHSEMMRESSGPATMAKPSPRTSSRRLGRPSRSTRVCGNISPAADPTPVRARRPPERPGIVRSSPPAFGLAGSSPAACSANIRSRTVATAGSVVWMMRPAVTAFWMMRRTCGARSS